MQGEKKDGLASRYGVMWSSQSPKQKGIHD